MIIFLRNHKNETLVDCEVYPVTGDSEDQKNSGYVKIHSTVIIDTYTDLLLNNIQHAEKLKDIFVQIQRLRRWSWETRPPNANQANEIAQSAMRIVDLVYDEVCNWIRKIFADFENQINDLCNAKVVFVVED